MTLKLTDRKKGQKNVGLNIYVTIFFSINIYCNEKYVFMREVLKEINAEYKT